MIGRNGVIFDFGFLNSVVVEFFYRVIWGMGVGRGFELRCLEEEVVVIV